MGSPISSSHIIVLFLYCNFSSLQYEYKKYGTRYHSNKQSFEDLKEKQKEIYHWYRLLFQLCTFYGQSTKGGDIFYTGLNIRLTFKTFNPEFYAPISTSTSYFIAEKFADNKGLILQLTPTISSKDSFFDCQLFSDFPDEKENLFFIAHYLEIMDIDYYNFSDVYSSINWIPSFKLFSCIFNGNYVFITSKQKELEKSQKQLLKLIKTFKVHNNINITDNDICYNVPVFMQQLFYQLLHKLKKIKIIPSQYLLLNQDIHRELLEVVSDSDTVYKLQLNPVFAALSIDVNRIIMLQEFKWIFSEEELNKLKEGKPDQIIQCGHRFKFRSMVTFTVDIRRKGGGSTYSGFGFTINKLGKQSISGFFSVMVDQCQYVVNNHRFKNLKEGEYYGIRFFADSLIDSFPTLSIHISMYFY